VGVVKSLRRNRSGRLFMGVRDNPRLMEAFGVSTVHTRLVAFAVSGAIAALAGALLAYDQATVDAGTFTPERSIQVFVMTVIGGIGSVGGAILGAVFVLGVPRLPGVRQLALVELLTSGLGVLIILYFLPGGLTEGAYRLRDRYLRWVAARHDIHVPSLIADSLVDTADDDAIIAAAEADHHLPRGEESALDAETSGEAEPVAVGDGPGAEDEGQWS
jgi:branched-chain amino acid transport system permease protein